MTVCGNRANQDPSIATCQVDLGAGKSGCMCRIHVELDHLGIKVAEVRAEIEHETEVGQARVPDSARDASGCPLVAPEVTGG